MSVPALIPAVLAFQDGIPFADAFDDVYHSAVGGLEQARYVFIGGNALPQRWQAAERFSILEIGFGLGLNFMATWQAWEQDAARCEVLHYTAIEKHPFRQPDLAQLHARWPELAAYSAELIAAWPSLVPGFHRILLAKGKIVLTLIFGDVADSLPRLDAGKGFDAFYLDGFAPSKNPDMWDAGMLTRLGRLAARGATAATYTVAASVRAALTQGGFICEKRPGFGWKRDMLHASYQPRWKIPEFTPPQRHAIVLGAGLAGATLAHRLCARGWRVSLIERHDGVAQEISGNRAGIALPRISHDDNPGSRLARAGFLFAQKLWREVGGIGKAFSGVNCGVLQLAEDDSDALVQQRAAACFPHAPEFVQWLDRKQIQSRFGLPMAQGGWLFEQGGWVHPASFCEALLAHCGDLIERIFRTEAARFDFIDGQWEARNRQGELIARAPHVVVANGNGARTLAQTQALPLWPVRGQVTHASADALAALPLVVCGEASVSVTADGGLSVGATYDLDSDAHLRRDSQQLNLARLRATFPGMINDAALAKLDDEKGELSGRVGFRSTTPDRLPMVGTVLDTSRAITGTRPRDVPRHPNLVAALGYGSRGLIWAPICAELLASQLNGDPAPIANDLIAAMDPARFALREHRRASAQEADVLAASETG